MDYLEHNSDSWSTGVMSTSVWARPVDDATIERARAGDWSVILTPVTPVPREWLGDVAGLDILCLASGGGQQAPVLAAAGARVVSFDLSFEQLRKDSAVARRHSLTVRCIRGDMARLECLRDGSFDLVFNPVSNVFVPELEPIWRGCHRVLRAGGRLLTGFMTPAAFLFDHEEADATGQLVVRYALPYSDPGDLSGPRLQKKVSAGEPLEFSHTLASQIGGQIGAGFVIDGFYEDRWLDDSWPFANVSPVCIATRAVKP